MNNELNQLEKNAPDKKRNVASKKNSDSSSKKQIKNASILIPTWEWENNPEYDEFWKNN
ncbi:MAG: hypothetical protein WCX31_11240 [Salinivirgaceae bacterium]|jgi:hypothetical protein